MMQQDASGRCKTFKPKMLQRPYQGHSLGFILQCKVGQRRRTMPARFTMRARAYNVTATALVRTLGWGKLRKTNHDTLATRQLQPVPYDS